MHTRSPILLAVPIVVMAAGCDDKSKDDPTDMDTATDAEDTTDTATDPVEEPVEDPIPDTTPDTIEDPEPEGFPPCAAFDDPCDPLSAAAPPFVCISLPSGEGYCSTTCDPDAEPDPCPDSGECIPDGGSGLCRRDECSGFFGTDCGTGEDCLPTGETAVNLCTDKGTTAVGDPCMDLAECVVGAICIGVCEAPDCAPLSGTVTCTSPTTCGGLMWDHTIPIDIGFCRCAPFVTPGGCDPGDWCYPDWDIRGVGTCVEDTGTAGAGDPCDDSSPATTCDAGMFCLWTSDTGGECQVLCDPLAAGSDPGRCAGTQEYCPALRETSGTTLAIGTCSPSCGFHEAIPCVDSSLECTMGELWSIDDDPCWDIPTILGSYDDCSGAGLSLGDFCGPSSLCHDPPGHTNVCVDACVPTVSEPYGTVGHPDCRDVTATCTDAGLSGYGFCFI